MVKIVLMYYLNPLNPETFFTPPDADLKIMLVDAAESPPGTNGNYLGGLVQVQKTPDFYISGGWARGVEQESLWFSGQ